MSVMLEVFYKMPTDAKRDAIISAQLARLGGKLTFREEPDVIGTGPVCLTFEFDGLDPAQEAANRLRSLGEHVEGPMDYGESTSPKNGRDR